MESMEAKRLQSEEIARLTEIYLQKKKIKVLPYAVSRSDVISKALSYKGKSWSETKESDYITRSEQNDFE